MIYAYLHSILFGNSSFLSLIIMGVYKEIMFFFSLFVLLFLFIPIKIDTMKEDFDLFLARYNKTYNSSEYERHLEIFRKSKSLIHSYNSWEVDNLSALYGLTEFTDLIPEAFLSDLLYPKIVLPPKKLSLKRLSDLNIPQKLDWREKGVISAINNQGTCGACWAFTAIENIETMNAIKTKKLKKFSVQQMIDCSFVNRGCDGGDTCVLLDWIINNNVVVRTEEDYPLRLVTGNCKYTNSTNGIHIKKFKCENLVNNEEVILEYLATSGPVIAAVNAASWHFYLDGIIRYHCDGNTYLLNHAVQIVGYDISGPVPYYIARNSWGKNFGTNGYLKIAVGHNTCGIARKIVTITV